MIENPARCHFDTSVLLCKGAESASCLTPAQVAALNQLYAGGHLSSGKLSFPGYGPGGEAAKLRGFQADRDVKAADDKLALTLNSNDPDLSGFVAGGGKLISYHGWDAAAYLAPELDSLSQGGEEKLGGSQTAKSVRLFMVPGMQHCFGGNGAFSLCQSGAGGGDVEHDVDSALVDWVENRKAPERIVASKPDGSTTHPLCAFPKIAGYDGVGDVGSAQSYACVAERGGK